MIVSSDFVCFVGYNQTEEYFHLILDIILRVHWHISEATEL